MKKLLLKSILLLCALVAGSGSVWADTTYKLEQVTSVSAGNMYVFEQDGYVMNNTVSSKALQTTDNYKTKGLVGTETYVWTLVASDKGFKMNNVSITSAAVYLYSKSNSTEVAFNNTGTAWSFTFTEAGTVNIQDTGNDDRFLGYTTSTSHVYKAYATTNLSGTTYPHAIKVYQLVEEVDEPGTTASPSISGTESFLASTTVTITNDASADGAAIYYTLNGDDPTTTTSETCFAYSAPFELTASATVKAIAKHADDTNASSVVSKEFTKITPKANIAALVAGGAADYVTLTNALVTYKNGNNAYLEDASGAIYLLGCASELAAGDKITGVMNVTDYTIYNNLPEIKAFELADGYTKTTGNTVTPTEVTLATLMADDATYNSYLSRYVTIKGATVTSVFSSKNCTIQQGDKTITLRDQNGTATLTSTKDKDVNVTAHVAIYSSTKQIAVWEQSQIVVLPDRPTFSVAEGSYTEVQNVTLSCATDGATIYYTTDGSDPTSSSTVYSAAITVDATMTVKAIAIKEGLSSNIASATYTIDLTPSVSVSSTSIDATAEEGDGEITVTYNNMTSVVATVKFYESDGTTETTYDWFDAEINMSDNVYYAYSDNTGAARTAYIKVYTTSSAGEVYSDLITITQAAYVPKTTYTIATSIVSGKHYVIASGTDGDIEAMGYNKGNNRDAVDVKANSGSISFTEDAGVYEFVIYGPDANGRYSIYDETAGKEGYLYAAGSDKNYLKTQSTNDINGKWTISIDGTTNEASIVADGSSNRNVMQYNSGSSLFACYSSASQAAVYLYEKSGETTPTVNVNLAASGYASYCSPLALDLTPGDGYAAYAVTATSDATVTFTKIPGAVPAETPFILYGESKGGQSVTLSAATGAVTAVDGNMLIGTLAPTAITTVTGDYTNFGLSGGSFVKINDGTLPANKAYLPVLTSKVPAASRLTIVFDEGETTGVETVHSSQFTVHSYYDLQGRRVAQPTKGLYIVNGKKVVIK